MRRKKHAAIVGIGVPESPPPNRPHDHLAGQHYESFLSEQAGRKIVFPETPMQAAINGNNTYDPDETWVYKVYGEEVAKRRDWIEHNEPGGKTWKRGEFF